MENRDHVKLAPRKTPAYRVGSVSKLGNHTGEGVEAEFKFLQFRAEAAVARILSIKASDSATLLTMRGPATAFFVMVKSANLYVIKDIIKHIRQVYAPVPPAASGATDSLNLFGGS